MSRTFIRRRATRTFKLPDMLRSLVGLVLAFGILVSGCSGDADLPRNTQTVDGVTIYLGVMPTALIQGHSTATTDPQDMHGVTPKKQSSNHIVVALFDAETGARITDARIRAGVAADRSDNHEPGKDLEPMQINGTMTYGNFFPMQNTGLWRIHLEIVLVNSSRPIVADFAYKHAPDR